MITLERIYFGSVMNQEANLLLPQAEAALNSLKSKSCKGREFIGWYHWPKNHGFSLVKNILDWKNHLSYSYDLVVVIGIGGSYLGSRAVSDLTSHTFGGSGLKYSNTSGIPIVFAGHNMSETSLSDLLDLMKQRSPIVNVISKSGTTTEPGIAFRIIRDHMHAKFGSEAANRIVVTTDASKGALRKLAHENHYKTFDVPDDVGGRYSVLTAVGLVPLALQGYDIAELINGAHVVFEDLDLAKPQKDGRFILEYASCRTAAWNHDKKIEVLAHPEPKMRNLAEWWKQLFGESDGKEGKGLFPASIECTMDLHSMGQYMQEGARTMIETFLLVQNPKKLSQNTELKPIKVPSASSNLDELSYLEGRSVDEINLIAAKATAVAHTAGGVPVLILSMPDFTPHTIGRLFAFFEVTCAIGGLMLGVNPFNQPGVEAYKVKMFELLGKPQTK